MDHQKVLYLRVLRLRQTSSMMINRFILVFMQRVDLILGVVLVQFPILVKLLIELRLTCAESKKEVVLLRSPIRSLVW